MSKKDKKEEDIEDDPRIILGSKSENEDEEEGDPAFNSDTQKIEHQVVVPEVEEDTDDPAPTQDEGDWLSDEFSGQLSVDVYQTDKEIVIKSTIAGVRSDNLDVQVTNDMVTIKGIRRMEEEVDDEDYFYRECYWGKFSRSIILPVDVRNDQVTATVKNGVLTVRLPKTEPTTVSVVKVKE